MKNPSLEAKLRAIQDLKAERYIGTQEAWEYLKGIEALYENPKKVASIINQRLQKDFGSNLYYPANEERIFGIVEKLDELQCKAYDLDDKFEREFRNIEDTLADEINKIIIESQEDIKKIKNNQLWQIHFILEPIPSEELSKFIDFVYPMFCEAQYPKVTDLEFGQQALELAFRDYPLSNKEAVMTIIRDQASILNWHDALSRESMIKKREEYQRNILGADLSLKNRMGKIIRDKIDNKLERRREILTDFILEHRDQFDDNSYEGILDYINGITKTLHIIKIKEYDSSNLMGDINFYSFIRDILVRERNFVERYLRS